MYHNCLITLQNFNIPVGGDWDKQCYISTAVKTIVINQYKASGYTVYLLANSILKVLVHLQILSVNWRINELLLPHNLYFWHQTWSLFFCSHWRQFFRPDKYKTMLKLTTFIFWSGDDSFLVEKAHTVTLLKPARKFCHFERKKTWD